MMAKVRARASSSAIPLRRRSFLVSFVVRLQGYTVLV